MTTPTFSVHEHTIVYESPECIADGIEIDTKGMSQTFVHLLMHHMGEGNIRVRVARMKEAA